ncbi:SDR family NAD(P)-dependent oxidoreductase [Holospora curviuscula]|nr:SDR family oxidoreductase [Holospora curviuscula]
MSKKWALITGATSGIGLEFSKLLAETHDLILVGRNELKLSQTKKDLFSKKSFRKDLQIQTIVSDLSDTKSAEFIFKECQNRSLEIEVLINNAGVGVFGEHVTLFNEDIIHMLNINIISLTLLSKYFAYSMKQRRSGFILNVASLAAYQPVPWISSYAASKSYVLNFSEALSKELEDYNISVTCLSPGHTRTNFFKSAGIGDKETGFYRVNTRMSVEKVAKIGLNALFRKRISVIPGIKNNILGNLNRCAPRFLVAKIAKFLTRNP